MVKASKMGTLEDEDRRGGGLGEEGGGGRKETEGVGKRLRLG